MSDKSSHNEHFEDAELDGELIDSYTRLTTHAGHRWDTRGPDDVTAAEAWRNAINGDRFSDEMSTTEGYRPDRVRLYRHSPDDGPTVDMVFICRDGPNPIPPVERIGAWTNVVTCYRVESIPNPRLEYEIRRELALSETEVAGDLSP